MPENAQHEIIKSGLIRRQSLSAVVVRACTNCGAPGYWHDDPGLPQACFDPQKKMLANAHMQGFAPVGPICPQCGADREDQETLGEIWSKTYRGPTVFEKLKDALLWWR